MPKPKPPRKRFLSTPSARRATVFVVFTEHHHAAFLSTPSARRATIQQTPPARIPAISIHALREEGDVKRSHLPGAGDNFYPRPPRGGRRED